MAKRKWPNKCDLWSPITITAMSESLNCVICSWHVLMTQNGNNLESSKAHSSIILKLLELDSSTYEWASFDLDSFYCDACDKKIEEIQETMHQLEVLQVKLKTFREEIESTILTTYDSQLKASGGGSHLDSKSDFLRNKIVADLHLQNGTHNNSSPVPVDLDIVKEEILPSIPSPLPSPLPFLFDDDDFDSLHCPDPGSFSCSTDLSSLDHSDPIENMLSALSKKQLRICLTRIDETFPSLKPNPAHSTQYKDDGFVPKDPFDASTYRRPSACKISSCTSTTIFARRCEIARHIRDVHVKKLMLPPDPLDEYEYPTLCRVENCTSHTLFESKAKLRRHIREVHTVAINLKNIIVDLSGYKKFPTKCREPSCKSNRRFNRTTLQRHIRLVHLHPNKINKPKEPWQNCTFPTKCPLPDCKSQTEFPNRTSLRRHILDTHQRKKIDPYDGYEYPTMCKIEGCKSVIEFTNKLKLRRHVREAHKIKARKYYSRSADPPGLPEHEILTTKQVICEICGATLQNAKKLESHRRTHTGEMLVCHSCGSQFYTEAGLKAHCDVHHAAVTPVYPCTLCPKTFKVRSGLRIHMWRHTGTRKKICPICSEAFMFKIELEEHKRHLHYKELGLQPFQCHVCNKIYSKRVVLEKHIKGHTGADRYACTHCNYHTDYRVDFNEHMSTVHCSDFPFKCTQCNKSFKLKRRLVEHEKSHQENYQFKCQLCDRRCSSGRTLKVHLRRKHTKEDLLAKNSDFNCDDVHGSVANDPETPNGFLDETQKDSETIFAASVNII